MASIIAPTLLGAGSWRPDSVVVLFRRGATPVASSARVIIVTGRAESLGFSYTEAHGATPVNHTVRDRQLAVMVEPALRVIFREGYDLVRAALPRGRAFLTDWFPGQLRVGWWTKEALTERSPVLLSLYDSRAGATIEVIDRPRLLLGDSDREPTLPAAERRVGRGDAHDLFQLRDRLDLVGFRATTLAAFGRGSSG